MAIRRYKMFAGVASTAAAVDTFTAQRPGRLKRIDFNCLFDCITDNGLAKVQVSRAAVNDFGGTAGAVTQALAQFMQQSNFVTSGLAQPQANYSIDCDDPIAVGEALYVNVVITGTVTITCEITLVMQE